LSYIPDPSDEGKFELCIAGETYQKYLDDEKSHVFVTAGDNSKE